MHLKTPDMINMQVEHTKMENNVTEGHDSDTHITNGQSDACIVIGDKRGITADLSLKFDPELKKLIHFLYVIYNWKKNYK